jgi:DNA-binding transcriptional ArsR family regulator
LNEPAETTAWRAIRCRSSTPGQAERPGNGTFPAAEAGYCIDPMDEPLQKKFAKDMGNPYGPHRRAAPEQMRAVVHPVRMRIIDALRNDGPSTATKLAQRLGESSGSTSYHLRVLAQAGVIEEDPERGNGRERWWRRVQPFYMPTDHEDPDGRALEIAARLAHIERDEEALQRYILGFDSLPTEWNAAATTSSFPVYMTADELMAFAMEWLAKIEQYQRPPGERPEGAQRVVVSLRALPWIEEEGAAEP